MRVRLLCLLATLTTLAPTGLAFPPIPPPRPGKGEKVDLKVLEGTWTVVKYESGLAKTPMFNTMFKSIVIKGAKWEQIRAEKGKGKFAPDTYTFRLDTTKSPAHIDMTRDASKGGNLGSRRGVLELKGDQLIVAYGMVSKDVVRPEKPDATLKGLQYRWILKREKR